MMVPLRVNITSHTNITCVNFVNLREKLKMDSNFGTEGSTLKSKIISFHFSKYALSSLSIKLSSINTPNSNTKNLSFNVLNTFPNLSFLSKVAYSSGGGSIIVIPIQGKAYIDKINNKHN